MIEVLQKAWDLRASLHSCEETNVYRLFCGEGEGIPGVVVDRLGDVIILQKFEGLCTLSGGELKEVGTFFLEKTKAQACYLKHFIADRTKEVAGDAMYSEVPFLGTATAPEILCRENSVSFTLRPYDGFSYGLFLDQRENRKAVAELSAGKEIFNGFSYTCGFSVYAALSGAKVTSVDLSKSYLEWGKKNFAANKLPLEGHRFIADDVFSVLEKDIKKGRQYGLVVLDPPSFSRSKKTCTFSLKNDFPELVKLATDVLSPGGHFFFSCNYSAWSTETLKAMTSKLIDRPFKWRTLPPVLLDFQRQAQNLSAFLITL